jgi:hypothetical protein
VDHCRIGGVMWGKEGLGGDGGARWSLIIFLVGRGHVFP